MSTATTAIAQRDQMYLDRDAVITARMPTPDECARGYAADVPVLAVTYQGAPNAPERVFRGDLTSLIAGTPRGTSTPDEATRAGLYALDIISEELGSVVGRVDALAAAAGVSPDAVGRLGADWRRERYMEVYCADTDLCEDAARAAAAFAEADRAASPLGEDRPGAALTS